MQHQVQGFRLSPQQRRLWLLDGAVGGGQAQCAILIRGSLDPAALERALAHVVGRHHVLRTTFHQAPGMRTALQVLGEQPLWSFENGATAPSEGEPRQIAERLLAAELRRVCDTERGPILRSRLVILAPQTALWTLSLPSLAADRRSLSNLFREVIAALAGGETGGDEDVLQFLNVSEWQNDLLDDEDAAEGRSYWRRVDLEVATAGGLPGETPAVGESGRPVAARVPLTPEDLAALAALVTEEVPLPAVLLAGWQALLARLTGRNTIGLGAVLDGRKYEDLDGAVGLVARSVPLVVQVDADLSFRQLVGRTARGLADAARWQEYFTWESERDAALPRFAFGFETEELPAARSAGGCELEMVATDVTTEPFGTQLVCRHQSGVWSADVRCDGAQWAREDAELLAGRLAALLADAARRPEGAVGDLVATSPAERDWLVRTLNDTSSPAAADACLHELVAARAAEQPAATAALCRGRSLTFSELDAHANALARRLRDLGVGPEIVVGLCSDRSLEALVGVLAILKAGGAYLPLDPSYPAQRLSFMLEEAGVAVILVDERQAPSLPPSAAALVILDGVASGDAGGEPPPPVALTPENLAYVIYTSGSTGQPKGVMVPHRGVVNYLRWAVDAYDVATGDGAPVHSALGFDLTVTSLFAPLLAGRSVELLPQDDGVEALADALQGGRRFSFVKLTPSHLDVLDELLGRGAPLAARTLILGGEALFGERLAPWRERSPGLRLVNEYGPTETVVGCAVEEVAAGIPPPGPVAIGSPVANARLFVLDPSRQLVPRGVTGELYVGGVGVARGYLRRPDLTAERFVPDPWSGEPGERLYRTGDLVRHRASGSLEFLGRADHQVKIRGFRVELGEIETLLAQAPGVRQCVVVLARESDHPRLVAYVVPEPGIAMDPGQLAAFLAGRLPEHMVPAVLVPLQFMPLTVNGKVDRVRLPAPERSAPAGTFEPPRSREEAVLARIWQEVLRLDKVGVHDNFFRLGGDSILGVQVMARANEAGLGLTSRQLFLHQTIAELAAVAGTVDRPAVDQGSVAGPVPLTPIQAWFFEQDLPDPRYFNQSLLLAMPRAIAPRVIAAAFGHLLRHHDALRLRFARDGSGWRQWNAPPDDAAPFTWIDLRALPAPAQARAREESAGDAQRSLDLAAGPLLRAVLFDSGAEVAGRLLVVAHHLVTDGVSSRILLEDLQQSVHSLGRGEPPRLPAKTASYQRWAEALAARLRSDEVSEEMSYWASPARRRMPALPVDHPGGEDTVALQGTVTVWLDEEETRLLLKEVPSVYHTQINDVLLTGLVEAFAGWTGSRRLLVDLESHGRDDLGQDFDASRTIGWFTAFFPVLLDTEDADDLGEALKAVKEQLRAVPRGGLGFGMLRYLSDLPAQREALLAMPRAGVIFNYLGQFDQNLPEGAQLVPLREPIGPARDPRGRRAHGIAINSRVLGGRLVFDWSYGGGIYRRETIERLAGELIARLQALLAHCRSPEAGGYTPSDFPLARVGQEDLDRVFDEVELDE